jgi:hypothetical protein
MQIHRNYNALGAIARVLRVSLANGLQNTRGGIAGDNCGV